MSQLRLNPLAGRWVTISGDRAFRPAAFDPRMLVVEPDPRPCPFCPGHEEATPPALETYGPAGQWLVRVVPNAYPAFSGHDPLTVEHLGPVFTQARASGIHEILVISPEHDISWADLDDKQSGLVMAAMRDRFEDHASTPGVRYTQAIVNHGREAGASLEHPHGQLLGIPFVPKELADEEHGFERFAGWPVPVLFVAGNHEFDDRELDGAWPQLRDRWHGCGPGHTFDVVERIAGSTRVRPFLGYAEWLAEVGE